MAIDSHATVPLALQRVQKCLSSGFMEGTGPVNAAYAEEMLQGVLVEPHDTTCLPRIADRRPSRGLVWGVSRHSPHGLAPRHEDRCREFRDLESHRRKHSPLAT